MRHKKYFIHYVYEWQGKVHEKNETLDYMAFVTTMDALRGDPDVRELSWEVIE